ncbi:MULTISPECIES: alkyl/aryl-sulfatase [unclassified Novosphingobium]|uniref:alkyl/aryl-sulfatase n=1 Tax=unclassified Novosphingobium TaxID=2644732 RepID=UPI00163DB9FC|nr:MULTISPECIES: alkyl sulfatase dimerization domain-containing protein [unclassified Novosphingobium]WRT95563.1 alkyl sulfatase dimerization domain-containing protein [Novosphingobium sp. RL4]
MTRRIHSKAVVAAISLAAFAAGTAHAQDAGTAESKPASPATLRYFEETTSRLPWNDREDFELASRGFIAGIPGRVIAKEDGRKIRDLSELDMFKGPRPDSVNPSLWRNAQLLSQSGLFKVTDRVYQVRGIELANLTVVLGKTGYIVVDTLTTVESAKAAMDLVRAKLGDRQVVAVIYTHSHIDHFGGAAGVIGAEEAARRKVPIIAPGGFLKEAISENVIAGPAMSRRATYAFGHLLGTGARADVSDGIGPAFNRLGMATGTVRMLPPTREIHKTGETATIDGVQLEFQYMPNTEAPAEMAIYFPGLRVLDMAENANSSLHNILTLRGAQVRDAKAWADDLTESIRLYGAGTDTLITSHFWPHWGNAKILDYLSAHRDMYKYLHDQSVRMMNQGLNGTEIAENLKLPAPLADRWFNQGYYGTLSHNAKAVYQRYMGWYDGNPANLNPLPPQAAAPKYVAAMGGPDAVLAQGRKAIEGGDYRWASELLSRLVFAEPDNRAAKLALADSLEQQGYEATSSMWRNAFLSGAKELREGVKQAGFDSVAGSIPALSLDEILNLLAVRLVPERALAQPMTLDLALDGGKEAQHIEVRSGVLIHQPVGPGVPAAPRLEMTHAQLVAAITNKPPVDPLDEDRAGRLKAFLGLFEAPRGTFGLVAPAPQVVN